MSTTASLANCKSEYDFLVDEEHAALRKEAIEALGQHGDAETAALERQAWSRWRPLALPDALCPRAERDLKETLEDQLVFIARLEFLNLWRVTYGGDSVLVEVERLYRLRRAGGKRLYRWLTVTQGSATGWYWKRSGEGRQAVYAAVCPRCLPGPPGSGLYVQGRYMGIGRGDLGYQRGEGPWDLECTECGREGTVS